MWYTIASTKVWVTLDTSVSKAATDWRWRAASSAASAAAALVACSSSASWVIFSSGSTSTAPLPFPFFFPLAWVAASLSSAVWSWALRVATSASYAESFSMAACASSRMLVIACCASAALWFASATSLAACCCFSATIFSRFFTLFASSRHWSNCACMSRCSFFCHRKNFSVFDFSSSLAWRARSLATADSLSANSNFICTRSSSRCSSAPALFSWASRLRCKASEWIFLITAWAVWGRPLAIKR
mmetsp:Transcript_76256/g.203927  ORF Transcript_76256/g.203927 Transcript_76256/m.203927 type:complete len:245 (-) Transcript_76256:373-1107(-)